MFIIRWLLGCIILGLNFIFSPRSPKREASVQQAINDKTQYFTLYQLPACPFCVKVRRAMKRDGLNIELRNISQNEAYREELIKEGGKRTVPCLKITDENEKVTWLYESSDVINYLQQFAR